MIFLTYLSLLVYEVLNYVRHGRVVYGERQSPVDIDSTYTEYDEQLLSYPIVIDYNTEQNMEMTNTGHTVQANISQASTISGGPLSDTYQLEQFHLHWGANDDRGSEHTLEGRSYAAELHLVHWNRDQYPSIAEAADKQDGLAVLGVFLQLSDDDHPGFRALAECMDDVTAPDECSRVKERFNPVSLLPDNTTDFWTYAGSLTTPPFSESVTWMVFREPIKVSVDQLESLRSLRCNDGVGEYIVDNFRPICPINDRTITSSFHMDSV